MATDHKFKVKHGLDVNGDITGSGNVTITGGNTDGSGNAFVVNRGGNTQQQALRIQNSGEVVVSNNYLYAAQSGTSFYSQGDVVVRGNLRNDSNSGADPLKVSDKLNVTGDIQSNGTVILTSSGRNLTNIGTIFSGHITVNTSTFKTTNDAIGLFTTDLTVGNNVAQQSTATPKRIFFNNDYSSGYTDASLKLYLFNDSSTRQGFTSGPAYDLQYHSSGSSSGRHAFYVANVEEARIDAGGIDIRNGGLDINGTQVISSSKLIENVTLDSGSAGARRQVDAWHYDSANNRRFYFDDAGAGNTYYGLNKTGAGHIFRNGSDQGKFTISSTGGINIAGGDTQVTGTTAIAYNGTAVLDTSRNLVNIGTINTGQGATEVYLMNQNVRSSDSPTFADLTVTGNLNLTGDINSYNITDLDVVDKTITLGVGGTALANDGGGIVVDGANAKLTWNNTNSYWQMNKQLAFNDTATTSNQGLGIRWSGFDKEGTTDFTDRASIIHTVNTGGHTGSVLLFTAENDANDGIAFTTNASSYLKHNSSNILTAANAFGQLGITSTVAELNYTDGVTSNIQTQLNARTTVTTSGYNGTYNIPIHYNGVLYTTPTAGAVQITGSSGQITTPSHGNSSQWNTAYGWGNHASAGYLTASSTAVTNKLPLAGGTMTGAVTMVGQTWNGDITWNNGKNILVGGESSIDVSGSGYFQVWDNGSGAAFIKCDVGTRTEIGNAGSRGLLVIGEMESSSLDVNGGADISGALNVGGNLTIADQIRIGDDAWLEDFNVANSVRVKGNQANNQGYIAFGQQTAKLGCNNTSTLSYNGNNLIDSSGNIYGTSLYVTSRKVLDLQSNSSNTERGPWNPLVTMLRGAGRKLHVDEDFASGSNGVNVYNNAGGGTVAHTREDATTNSGGNAPNSSGKVIKIAYNGGTASPGFGGFVQNIPSEDNHTFVQIFQAKLPTGKNLVIAENAQGSNNKSYFLTDTAGTGKWEWYARVSHCGNSGTFSSGGHIYVTGGSGAFNWYLASCTVIDVTESYSISNRMFHAQTVASNSQPLYSFNSDTDTGLGYIGTNAVGLIAGASRKMYVNSSNAYFQNISGGVIFDNVPAKVITGTLAASDAGTKGLIFDGNYTNGQYRHRWRKQDKGGGVPLYLDISEGTANSYTEMIRFGPYSGNSQKFEVYGNAKVDNLEVSSGSTSSLTLGTYSTTDQGILYLTGSSVNKQSVIKTTNGNLHIDSNAGNNTYINYYTGSGTYFGGGAGNIVAVMGADGDLWKGSSDNSGSKYWHAGNDGSGSGLDADNLDGRTWSESVVANTIVSRQANGYIYANHINFNTSETENPTIGSFFVSNGDGWSRKASKAHVLSQLGVFTTSNDGSGSGLDADLLDGIQGSAFLRNDTSGTMSGELNVSHNGGATGSSAPSYSQANIELQTSSNHVPAISFHRGGYSATTLYEYDGELYVNAWTTRNQTGKLVSFGNDGSGSGLDADTVDGIQGASLLRSDANDTYTGTLDLAGVIKDNGDSRQIRLMHGTTSSQPAIGVGEQGLFGMKMRWDSGSRIEFDGFWSTSVTGSRNRDLGSINVNTAVWELPSGVTINGSTAWHAGNDGSGSGLDADTLDGIQGASFLRSDAADTATQPITLSGGSGTSAGLVINRNIATPSNYYNGLQMEVRATSGTAGIGLHRNGYSHVGIYHNTQNRLDIDFNSGDVIINHNAGTLWGSGNDGSGSGLDADLLDGTHLSAIYSNSAVANTSVNNLYENSTITYGGSYLQWTDLSGTGGAGTNGNAPGNPFSDWHHHLIMNHGNSGGYYVDQAFSFHSNRVHFRRNQNGSLSSWYEFWHTGNDGSGSGLDADLLDGYNAEEGAVNNSIVKRDGTASIKAFGLSLLRQSTARTGITWYNESYYNWQDYMASAGVTGCGPNGNLTAPTGLAGVTSWALRSRMEGVSTYGWNWETGSGGGGGATATSKMSLNATTGNLQIAGSFTAGADVIAYSDEKLKDDVQVIENAVEKVKQVRGVTFTRNDLEDQERHAGVIAQEVEKVLPEVVGYDEDRDTKTVAYGNMVGLLIEAIKEQQETIDKLTSRINDIEKGD